MFEPKIRSEGNEESYSHLCACDGESHESIVKLLVLHFVVILVHYGILLE